MTRRPLCRAATGVALGLSALALSACAGDEALRHHAAPGALGPYSGAVLADDFVFVAGKVGGERATLQTEVLSAIDAVEQELGRAGLDLGAVVSATVYLTDIADYASVNEVYAARFPAPYPARACVAVAALPGGARVEIQVIAARR